MHVEGGGFTWRCKSLTGQTSMFWVDLLLLTCFLFYLDWGLDVLQLLGGALEFGIERVDAL